jgi:hypothetical protein
MLFNAEIMRMKSLYVNIHSHKLLPYGLFEFLTSLPCPKGYVIQHQCPDEARIPLLTNNSTGSNLVWPTLLETMSIMTTNQTWLYWLSLKILNPMPNIT